MTDLADPFNRKQVESICRAVCEVEGIDPDESPFDIDVGSDPNWTRYADAVFAALVPAAQPPVADLWAVIEIADRNEFAPQISRVKVWLNGLSGQPEITP